MPKKKAAKEDDYLSDFEDENFDIEGQETKIALATIALIKEGMESLSSIETVNKYLEMSKQIEKSPMVCLQKLVGSHLALDLSSYELESVLNRTNCHMQDYFQLKQLLDKIHRKDMKWWHSKIDEDSFEINYDTFDLTHFNALDNPRRDFTLGIIVEKIRVYNIQIQDSSSIGAKNVGVGSPTSQLADANAPQASTYHMIRSRFEEKMAQLCGDKQYLNKNEFRQLLLFMEYPLSRKEQKIMFCVLDYHSSQQGKIFPQDLRILLYDDPEKLVLMCNELPPYKEQLVLKQQEDSSAVFSLKKIRMHLQQSQTPEESVRDVFRLSDVVQKDWLDAANFAACVAQLKWPIDQDETSRLYEYISGNYCQLFDALFGALRDDNEKQGATTRTTGKRGET